MNVAAGALSVYFPERLRVTSGRPGFLADRLLDLCADRGIVTSVMLRGVTSFGPIGLLRSDESLTLSEDPPSVVHVIDEARVIDSLIDDAESLLQQGMVTVEHPALIRGAAPANLTGTVGSRSVKVGIYVGRLERVGLQSADRVVCDALWRHGFEFASAFLGVDGTAHGRRYRARFFSRNVNVPTLIVGVGTASRAAAAIAELALVLPNLVVTIDDIEVWKHGAELRGQPPVVAVGDRPQWLELEVHTTEGDVHEGMPVHREIVRRLMQSRAAQGATAVRGIWGFQGADKPHGDRIFQLVRKVPVVTTIIDTPEAIARSFGIVKDIIGPRGVVTCQRVPAALSVGIHGARGYLRPVNDG